MVGCFNNQVIFFFSFVFCRKDQDSNLTICQIVHKTEYQREETLKPRNPAFCIPGSFLEQPIMRDI